MVQLEGVICTGGGCNERRIRSGEDTIVTQKARTPRTPSALAIEETQRVQEKRKEGLLYRVKTQVVIGRSREPLTREGSRYEYEPGRWRGYELDRKLCKYLKYKGYADKAIVKPSGSFVYV